MPSPPRLTGRRPTAGSRSGAASPGHAPPATAPPPREGRRPAGRPVGPAPRRTPRRPPRSAPAPAARPPPAPAGTTGRPAAAPLGRRPRSARYSRPATGRRPTRPRRRHRQTGQRQPHAQQPRGVEAGRGKHRPIVPQEDRQRDNQAAEPPTRGNRPPRAPPRCATSSTATTAPSSARASVTATWLKGRKPAQFYRRRARPQQGFHDRPEPRREREAQRLGAEEAGRRVAPPGDPGQEADEVNQHAASVDVGRPARPQGQRRRRDGDRQRGRGRPVRPARVGPGAAECHGHHRQPHPGRRAAPPAA